MRPGYPISSALANCDRCLCQQTPSSAVNAAVQSAKKLLEHIVRSASGHATIHQCPTAPATTATRGSVLALSCLTSIRLDLRPAGHANDTMCQSDNRDPRSRHGKFRSPARFVRRGLRASAKPLIPCSRDCSCSLQDDCQPGCSPRRVSRSYCWHLRSVSRSKQCLQTAQQGKRKKRQRHRYLRFL